MCKKRVESHIHTHTHVRTHAHTRTHQGHRKTGLLQGVLNEHSGISSLGFMSIINHPVQVVLVTRMECSR